MDAVNQTAAVNSDPLLGPGQAVGQIAVFDRFVHGQTPQNRLHRAGSEKITKWLQAV